MSIDPGILPCALSLCPCLLVHRQLERISLIVIVAEKRKAAKPQGRKGNRGWQNRPGKINVRIGGVSERFIWSRVASQNLWRRHL